MQSGSSTQVDETPTSYSAYGVSVFTWETGYNQNKFAKPAKAITSGGNVGHASLMMRLPNTQETADMLLQYTDIHFAVSVEPLPKDLQQEDGPKDMVVVYFSWWPAGEELSYFETDDFGLSPSLTHDMNDEWTSSHVDFNSDVRAGLTEIVSDIREQSHEQLIEGAIAKTSTVQGLANRQQIHPDHLERLKAFEACDNMVMLMKSAEYFMDPEARESDIMTRTKLTWETIASLSQLLDANDIQSITETLTDIEKDPTNIAHRQAFYLISEQVSEKASDLAKHLEVTECDRESLINGCSIPQDSFSQFLNLNNKLNEKKKSLETANLVLADLKDDPVMEDINALEAEIRSLSKFDAIKGQRPDNEVRLPIDIRKLGVNISRAQNTPSALDNALNVKDMFAQIRELTKKKPRYHVFTKNCSSTVEQVLTAGCPNKKMRSCFTSRNPFRIVTPQSVMGRALKFQNSFYAPQTKGLRFFRAAFKISALRVNLFKHFKNKKHMPSPDAALDNKVRLGNALNQIVQNCYDAHSKHIKSKSAFILNNQLSSNDASKQKIYEDQKVILLNEIVDETNKLIAAISQRELSDDEYSAYHTKIEALQHSNINLEKSFDQQLKPHDPVALVLENAAKIYAQWQQSIEQPAKPKSPPPLPPKGTGAEERRIREEVAATAEAKKPPPLQTKRTGREEILLREQAAAAAKENSPSPEVKTARQMLDNATRSTLKPPSHEIAPKTARGALAEQTFDISETLKDSLTRARNLVDELGSDNHILQQFILKTDDLQRLFELSDPTPENIQPYLQFLTETLAQSPSMDERLQAMLENQNKIVRQSLDNLPSLGPSKGQDFKI